MSEGEDKLYCSGVHDGVVPPQKKWFKISPRCNEACRSNTLCPLNFLQQGFHDDNVNNAYGVMLYDASKTYPNFPERTVTYNKGSEMVSFGLRNR